MSRFVRGLFQTARTISTIDPTALLFAPGGHSPTGVFVAWCNVGTFVRLCFGVSCDICAGTFLLCDRGRGVAVVAVRPLDAITAVAVASWTSCRDRGRGFCVAVMWLRHADER